MVLGVVYLQVAAAIIDVLPIQGGVGSCRRAGLRKLNKALQRVFVEHHDSQHLAVGGHEGVHGVGVQGVDGSPHQEVQHTPAGHGCAGVYFWGPGATAAAPPGGWSTVSGRSAATREGVAASPIGATVGSSWWGTTV